MFNKAKLLEAFKIQHLSSLREYYRKPNFEFVSKMIDDICDNLDKIDEISNKYDIEFEDGQNSQLLVVRASYRSSDNKFHIWLSDRAIKSLQTKTNLNDLKREIESFLWHEDTHKQQNQEKNAEQPYFSDFEPSNWEEVKKYLSQYVEIDSFARCVAEDLWQNGADSKDLNNLESLDMSVTSRNLIRDYKKIGGKVWAKFLQEIYKSYNEPYVGGKDEYRQWLKAHQSN
jgi:hypothetical protein